jgi:hypothetical protein
LVGEPAGDKPKRVGVLKITTEATGAQMKIKLEGRLIGPWVKELESVWKSVPTNGKTLQVDMCSVSSVDSDGKELLWRMHRSGAELIADGPMTQYIISEAAGGTGNHQEAEE